MKFRADANANSEALSDKNGVVAHQIFRGASIPIHGLEIGIVGTFDVENYGDLLFPLIAQSAFDRRGSSVRVTPFSPNSRSPASWPFRVHSTLDLPNKLRSLSALLIGGGQLVRFDSSYPVVTDERVRLPLDYWLTPASRAAGIGKPVIWNAIGAWTGSPSAPEYDEQIRTTFAASYIVALRDDASRAHLRQIAPDIEFQFVPDTAFSLSRFWPLSEESNEYKSWRESLCVPDKYVVVQADPLLGKQSQAICQLINRIGVESAVLLPICNCNGDSINGVRDFARNNTIVSDWPAPKLLSEILGRSQFIIASSLHACITGISYGVPVARVPSFNSSDRKFEQLEGFSGVALIDDMESLNALVRRGKQIEQRCIRYMDRLDHYWDQVAQVVFYPKRHRSQRSIRMMQRIQGDWQNPLRRFWHVFVECRRKRSARSDRSIFPRNSFGVFDVKFLKRSKTMSTRNFGRIIGDTMNVVPVIGPFVRRIQERLRKRRLRLIHRPPLTVNDWLVARSPSIQPIRSFSIPSQGVRISVVTDSVSSDSLFGGVGTSLILATLVANRLKAPLRLVTRTAAPDARACGAVLAANGIALTTSLETLHLPHQGRRELPISERDYFISTSWWTTRSLLSSVRRERIAYLIQEDERMFYGFGDERLCCEETLREQGVLTIVNSELLYEHLTRGPDSLPHFSDRSIWFEPAFPSVKGATGTGTKAIRRSLFFYARPNNSRNLFETGITALAMAISSGAFHPSEWDIYFVGREIPDLQFPQGVRPVRVEGLNWRDYQELVRSMDAGFVLMGTPHPSYPPLDLAAAGAAVLTNACGNKQSLSQYSQNILVERTQISALRDGLLQLEIAAKNDQQRAENRRCDRICRDWNEALEGTVEHVRQYFATDAMTAIRKHTTTLTSRVA